ncbi:MAG: hypothetical protein QM278_02060 [Pseudomonadota bacterium]|nr:hypothetical protein [Pseudomonadota bacterium]
MSWEILLEDEGIEIRDREKPRRPVALIHGRGRGDTGPGGKPPPALLPASVGRATTSVARWGLIDTPAGCLALVSWRSSRRVHCLAATNGGRNSRGAPPDARILLREEVRDVSSDPSAAVRRAAIHRLAGVMQTSPGRLEVRREGAPGAPQGPPRIFLDGRPADIDISLSHDGAFIAFAWSMKSAGL